RWHHEVLAIQSPQAGKRQAARDPANFHPGLTMADWLLIRLGHDPRADASWLVADASGRMVMPVQRGPLADGAFLAASRRVCVLVPAPDVLLTDADVPVRTGAKVREVVPYALEEHLAEDIENLHFAVGKRAPDAVRTPVAVVSRSLMESWFAAL